MKERIKKAGTYVLYALTGAATGLMLNFLIMKSPLPELFPSYTESFNNMLHRTDLLIGILLYCIIAPVIEELIFRRLVYDWLYARLGFAISSVSSSLIFAIYHMNVIQGTYAFIMAMLFCAAYHRDHRIGVPISMHLGANLTIWLLSNLLFIG